MNEIGSRMALGMAISGVAALIGSPIMGAILRAGGGSFVGPAYFSGGEWLQIMRTVRMVC